MRIVQPINEEWQFHKEQPGEEWHSVTLPHTYNAVDGQDGSPMYRGPVVYKKTLNLLPEDHKVYYLEIGAASLAAEVIVNGISCAKSTCGFSMFRVPLTGRLKAGENEIEIKVTNGSTAKLYPAMADFSFYGGLYRGVSLITEDEIHFSERDLSRDGVIMTPEVIDESTGLLKLAALAEMEDAGGAFDYELAVSRSSGIACSARVLDAAGDIVAEETKTENAQSSVFAFAFSLEIPQIHLWNGLDDPYLYTVELTLMDGKGKVYDRRRLMTGFRTVTYDPRKGMLLNGKPIKLNGVARHQDFGGIGNVATPETMAIDMKLIREIGANSLRCSHYQHPDEWYDLCDRYGLLVWAEIPVISVVAQNPDADRNAFDQLDRLIAQARNHCCIYCWGVQNETCMGSNNAYTHGLVGRLAKRAKDLDPSRMTAQANEYTTEDTCPILYHTDISGHNLYYGWYYGEIPELQKRLDSIHEARPEAPIMLTEYGVDTNVQFHSLTPKANDYTEEYQLKFHQNALDAIDERTWMAGGYVWNMFDFGSAGRDEGGTKGKNQKGLVTIDRKIKKDTFYLYKAHWSKCPFVYIAGRRFKNRPQTRTDITVLSNMEEFTLVVNGRIADVKKAMGVGESADEAEKPINGSENTVDAAVPATGTVFMREDRYVTIFRNVDLLPGDNTVIVCGQNASGIYRIDQITITSVAEPDPAYVLKAKEKVVVDWFAGLDGEDFGIKAEPLRPEGFTFEDIIQDIYDNDRARGIFLKFLRPLTLNARFEGMKPFTTVNRLIGFANRDGSIPEALLKHCEQELNKIDK